MLLEQEQPEKYMYTAQIGTDPVRYTATGLKSAWIVRAAQHSLRYTIVGR